MKRTKPAPVLQERVLNPIDRVEWVDPKTLHANGYNPNHVFAPEMELLALSIIEDGWTTAIVVLDDGEVVDGFHRWTLGMSHPGVRAVSGCMVPVVRMRAGASLADRMIATIRHNRARGQHGITKMASIVRELAAQGLSDEEIERRLGMEDEERERLSDLRTSPEQAGKESFGRGWVPGFTPGVKP